ncbi:MAG TPA: hypothetical protein VMT93_03350 [Gemmatimonadaceae bacterium]|nr:hypothetical protein [Gemmatimonadaceae bacterium]
MSWGAALVRAGRGWLLGIVLAGAARAQDSAVVSMGLPPVWKPYAAGAAVFANTSSGAELGGLATGGVYRDLLNPMYGALGIAGEAYAGGQNGAFDAGARLFAAVPVLFVQGGVDYSFTSDRADFILSLVFPVNRGGFGHRGGQVRIDWLPTRGQTFEVGVQFPLFQPWVGRTRPYDLHVAQPRPPRSSPAPAALPTATALAVDSALDDMRTGARWLARLSYLYWNEEGSSYRKGIAIARQEIGAFAEEMRRPDALHPLGHTFAGEMALYHGALARAFAAASPDSAVRRAAYAIMRDEVVFAYDRNFGQYKKPETLLGFGALGRAHFAAWLADTVRAGAARAAASLRVYDQWLAAIEGIRAAIDAQSSDDPRLIWLPLQLVMRGEDYDTQPKIDAAVEALVRRDFARGSAAVYLDAKEFQFELARMILATERYHVLWIHDYAGVNAKGEPDSIGWAQTMVYLRALTEHVRAYDSTGRLPVYIIMADAYFTGTNKGALWLDLLERPLARTVTLPAAYAPMQRAVAAALDSLRAAVAASKRLQADAAAHGGAAWLEERVRVYVNLTGPSDLTFRTSHLLGVMFMSDNLIRDHRKIAFRDVSEGDPSAGEAIYGGVGVGQHYASATWEDRALLLGGPALAELKGEARETLRMNGFAPWQIPAVLRADPVPADYAARVDSLVAAGATGRAMDAENRVGWARKDASIVQMALYNLMPAGSVIIVPSSIWASALWASQLASAALRGCHVYVIGPSAKNASAASKYLLSRQSEIFARLILTSELLAPEIAAAGGALHVGIFDRDVDLANVAANLRRVAAAYRAQPFLRREFPYPASVYGFLDAAADTLDARKLAGQQLVGDVTKRDPLLHRKTQFFATRETLDSIARDTVIAEVFRRFIVDAVTPRTVHEDRTPPWRRPERALVRPLLRAYDELPAGVRARSVLYSAVGSINKDARGVYLDGEVYVLLAGPEALWTWPDYFMMLGWCAWPSTVEAMDTLVPPQSDFTRWMAYAIRRVL